MITKVIDHTGALVHDCGALGCDVSWDGYSLNQEATGIPIGTQVAGATALDPSIVVVGDTAQLPAPPA